MKLLTRLVGPRTRRALLVVIGAVMVLGAAYMLPRFVADFGFIVVPLVIVGFLALLALFVVPVDVLPALALTLYVLIPPRVLPQDGPLGALPLTSIVLVVWGFRRLILSEGNPERTDQERKPAPFKLAALLFGLAFFVWAALSLLRTPDVQTSLGWLISFTAGALLPLAIGSATKEAAGIRDMWLLLGGWLGAYAVVEAVVRINPLWGTLYDALGLPDAQHWAVYRASASFGHPLFAALFFAVACTLAIGNWLTSRSKGAMAAAVFSGLGLVATISRGALLGAAIAVAFAYIAALLIRGEKRWGRFGFIGLAAVIAVIGLFQFDAFAARSDSREGQLSSGARDTALWVTFRAADLTSWFGSGAGTSGITGRLFADVVIESALLQLVIGLGLPGLILFSLILASAFLHALSQGAVGPAAALLTYAICISTFNALDAVRPMHLLLGCLLILTLNPPGDDSPVEPDLTPAARKVSRADATH
ncbi:MAG TPA: O-antigen ligase family protein [Glaciibacter sp.]|nr:O-antigen ligase family protein [Glaciibacter sp.]